MTFLQHLFLVRSNAKHGWGKLKSPLLYNLFLLAKTCTHSPTSHLEAPFT